MMKFYYRVTVGNAYLKVTSMAKAKKLVQGQQEWAIARFEVATNSCIAITDPEWIKKVKDRLFEERVKFGKHTLTFVDFTKAFLKCSVAK
jgi:hypothetical protein